jgi:hypothetical protein
VYAEANNPIAMADAIAGLLDAPERRAAMSAVGQARLANELAWHHSEAKLLAAYERALLLRGRVEPAAVLRPVPRPAVPAVVGQPAELEQAAVAADTV